MSRQPAIGMYNAMGVARGLGDKFEHSDMT